MNANTKEKLEKLCDALTILAYGASSVIGTLTLAEIVTAAEELKLALQKDETILS